MPRITEQRKMEIVSIFQASFKRDMQQSINAVQLADLKDADEMLGSRDLNEGFRIALRNRIRDLEGQNTLAEQRQYESRIRILNIVVGFALGVLTTIAANWIA